MSEGESDIFKETHDHVSVDWTIKDFFPFRYKIDDYEMSPNFSLSSFQLNLSVYPNGEIDEDSNGFVGLYVSLNNDTLADITVTYTFGIRNRDGSIYKSYSSECDFHKHSCIYRGTPKLLKASELQKSKDRVSPDGTFLTLFCTAQVKDSSYVEAASRTWSLESVDTLSRSFQDLLLSGCHSDATVKIKDREIPVHRSILAARSSVFRSMFEHDMLEKNNGVIEIEEFEPEDFHDFLLFLYAGKKDHVTPANAPALYRISHKYELTDLSEVCMLCMKDKMSVESFCDIILLASVYDESGLLNVATNFFVGNARAIVRHPTWSSFSAANNSLANELFVKLTE